MQMEKMTENGQRKKRPLILLINGSRKEEGCTYTALRHMEKVLTECGMDGRILQSGHMVFEGRLSEAVDQAAQAVKEAEGLIVGSPVYYASPSGEIISFLDRLFSKAEPDLRFKPAAAVVSARRAGTTASLDVLNRYFAYNQMPVVASRYWTMVHGSRPEDVEKDLEGIQIVETAARNMAWLVESIRAGKKAGVIQPLSREKVFTNFIR